MSGCSVRPSIGVLGAYFPDWLFCAIGSLMLTLVVRRLAHAFGTERWLTPQPVIYPTLFTFFALAAWLLVFQH
jgi:YtcA family